MWSRLSQILPLALSHTHTTHIRWRWLMIEKWHLYSFPVRNFPSAAIRMLSMGHTGRRCTCTANLSALSKWLQRISFILSLQRLTFSIHEKYLPNTWALGCGYCCCCCTQSALCTCIFYQDWDVEAHTLLSRAKTFTVWSIFITQHAKVFTRGKMVVCTQEPAYTILETVWAHNYFEVENISDADGIKRALSALKMQVMLSGECVLGKMTIYDLLTAKMYGIACKV